MSPAEIWSSNRGYGIPWQGNYSSWLEQKQQPLEREREQAEGRRKAMALRLNGCGRTRKDGTQKASRACNAFRSLLHRTFSAATRPTRSTSRPVDGSGDLVIEVSHLCKAYGDRLLIDDLSFKLPPGGIVGVIGPNGAGKTTLFRMLTRFEAFDAGEILTGESVVLAVVDQSRDALAAEKTVWEESPMDKTYYA